MTIKIDRDELKELIANNLRYKALENNNVADWMFYNDSLADGLGDYYAEDGDYFTPYDTIAEAFVKEIERCR